MHCACRIPTRKGLIDAWSKQKGKKDPSCVAAIAHYGLCWEGFTGDTILWANDNMFDQRKFDRAQEFGALRHNLDFVYVFQHSFQLRS